MDLAKECAGAKRIGISTHIRPDGDAVGSSAALYLYLKKRFPEAELKLFMETPPDCFGYIQCLSDMDSEYAYEEVFDVFFALDTVPERMGAAEAFFYAAKKKINIDHHISNQNGSGDVNVVKPEVGSTSEVLYGLFEEAYLDKDIAMALYTGIIHDTGVFQYSNTTPETMRIAARLMEFGFPFHKIIEESFYQKTYRQNQILGRALMESILLLEGRVIMGRIRQKDMESFMFLMLWKTGIIGRRIRWRNWRLIVAFSMLQCSIGGLLSRGNI